MFVWRNETWWRRDDFRGDVEAHDDQNLRTIDVHLILILQGFYLCRTLCQIFLVPTRRATL